MLCLAIRTGVDVDIGGTSIAAEINPVEDSVSIVSTATGVPIGCVPLGESLVFAGGSIKFYKILHRFRSVRVPVLAFEFPKDVSIIRSDAIMKSPKPTE